MTHYTAQYRVYYEDTDAGGVVYYANYLKFAERARTDMLRDASIHQSTLMAEHNIAFVVRRAELDLKKPAKLDDLLTVTSTVSKMAGASFHVEQDITLNGISLATIQVQVACVEAANFRPTRIPDNIIKALGA
ncbi:MAG: 4-hydroxybenzoyl-CoA thioesterase family active site [Rickettsiales bacterium]|jgi:acyl-CoA thioester hydrolase|nr:4-hydroxybenzoyl-CoA thioesterase family active site [Rickettsiales bacterium]